MEKDDLEVTKMSHFVGVGLVLGFLLPHTSAIFLLVNPLLCLFYQCYKQNRVYYKWNWLVLVPFMITLLLNLPQGVSMKAIISCVVIMMYFASFPMVGCRVKVPVTYFYVILVFILLSQVAYAYNITFMERILDSYYPLSEEDFEGIHQQNVINEDNIFDFRLGGLYHNSNDCARALCFLLAGFLILYYEKPIRKLLPFVIISFFSVLMTGSRTGFVVASLVVITYLFVDKRVSVGWRYAVTFLAVLVFVYLILVGSSFFRGFDVLNTGSIDMKQDTFRYYLSTENSIFRLLLGYMDFSRYDTSGSSSYVMSKFDSDYGYIIFSYGFIGFFVILFYFLTIYRRLNKYGRTFFVLLLWMYSSTVLMSFRALFLFMLLLSCNYEHNKHGSE